MIVACRHKPEARLDMSPIAPDCAQPGESRLARMTLRHGAEIAVDALSVQNVIDAMRAGIHTVCALGLPQGISAGNYGGRLGKRRFHLWEIAGDTL